MGRGMIHGRSSSLAPDPFQALWFGQTVSALGTQVSMVALPLIAVLALHAGPLELGILAALETLPYLVLSLPAGVVVDRVDHRATMIACDVGRAVTLFLAAAAIPLGILSIGLLYTIALAVGALSVFFNVACTSYLAAILPTERLVAGNQRLEVSDSGARVVGPSIGGAVLSAAGAAAVLSLDGLSYVISALAIAGSRRPAVADRPPAGRLAGSGFIHEMGEGLRRVLGDRILRDLAGSTAVFNLGSGMLLAVLVLFATRDVGMGAAEFGLIYGVGNIGFIVGALSVGALSRRLGVGPTFLCSNYLGALAMTLIALAGGALGVICLLAGRFVGAVSAPIFNVNLVSLRQARTSDAFMGRVNATFQFIEWGTLPVGSLLGGIIGAALGTRFVLDMAAVCGIVSTVWIHFSPARRLTMLADLEPASDPGLPVGTGQPRREEPEPVLEPPLVA
jgi:MFS family permease